MCRDVVFIDLTNKCSLVGNYTVPVCSSLRCSFCLFVYTLHWVFLLQPVVSAASFGFGALTGFLFRDFPVFRMLRGSAAGRRVMFPCHSSPQRMWSKWIKTLHVMTIRRHLSNSADNYSFCYIPSLITINHHLAFSIRLGLTRYFDVIV